jgi:peroxiredoxin
MPLNRAIGDRFPDLTLRTDRDQPASISELTKGQPLFLAFFRGPW